MTSLLSRITDVRHARWLPWLCLVVLLHSVAINWALVRMRAPFERGMPTRVIAIELHVLTQAGAEPSAREAPPPELKPQPKPDVTQNVSPPPQAATGSKGWASNKPIDTRSASIPQSPAASLPETRNPLSSSTFQIDPPPSAKLSFAIQSTGSGRDFQGTGHITWVCSNRKHASISGEYPAASKNILHFESESNIDPEYGIAPNSYAEKSGDSGESKARFSREERKIIFSRSSRSYPRLGGEQDTASVIWQLAGIGRHSPDIIKTDAHFRMFVVNASHAEDWLINVMGLEEVDTPLGKIQAWHLRRDAPLGSKEQSVDLWLAPAKDWYPVKLRYTEANGDTLDLSVSEITPVPDT